MENMSSALEAVWAAFMELLMTMGLKVLYALILVIIGSKVIKWLCNKIDVDSSKVDFDKSIGSFLRSALKVILYTVLYISALLILGVPAASFVAILGSAGLAVGLALQGSLSNLAGSIMILLFHPYRVGDFVDANGVAGTVEEISLFYTTIITPDNKRIICPNGATSNGVITNFSSNTRRVDLTFSAAYGTDPEKVREVLMKIANDHKLVLADPAPVVLLAQQSESSVDFYLRVWCKGGDYWTVNFELNEQGYTAFNKNGIEIPFPQMDVHVKND